MMTTNEIIVSAMGFLVGSIKKINESISVLKEAKERKEVIECSFDRLDSVKKEITDVMEKLQNLL